MLIAYSEENTDVCLLILATIDKKRKYVTSTGLWRVKKPHRFCHRLDIDYQLETLYKSALEYHRTYLFPGYLADRQQCYLFTDSAVMIFTNPDRRDDNQIQNGGDANNSNGDVGVETFLELNTVEVDLSTEDGDGDQIMGSNGESAYVSEINDNSANSSELNTSEFNFWSSNLIQCQSSNQNSNYSPSNRDPQVTQTYERKHPAGFLSSLPSSSCQSISPKSNSSLIESRNHEPGVSNCPPSNQDPRVLQTYERSHQAHFLSSLSLVPCQRISPKSNSSLIESRNHDFPSSNSPNSQNLTELNPLPLPPNPDLSKTNGQLAQYSANGITNSSISNYSALICSFAGTNNDHEIKDYYPRINRAIIPIDTGTDFLEGPFNIGNVLSFDDRDSPLFGFSLDEPESLSHCEPHDSSEFLNKTDLYPKDSFEMCLLGDSAQTTDTVYSTLS